MILVILTFYEVRAIRARRMAWIPGDLLGREI